MTPQIRYIVAYKDAEFDVPLYFGPFVSSSIAEDFRDRLPAFKNPKGYSRVRMLEPYGYSNIIGACALIQAHREAAA